MTKVASHGTILVLELSGHSVTETTVGGAGTIKLVIISVAPLSQPDLQLT